jgi:hypothetical protein
MSSSLRAADFNPGAATLRGLRTHTGRRALGPGGLAGEPRDAAQVDGEGQLVGPRAQGIKTIRVWRERRASFGELVMQDSSPFRWLEEHGLACQLIAVMDDATSHFYARFTEHDSTEENLRTFGEWLRRYGSPVAHYTDRGRRYFLECPTLNFPGDAFRQAFHEHWPSRHRAERRKQRPVHRAPEPGRASRSPDLQPCRRNHRARDVVERSNCSYEMLSSQGRRLSFREFLAAEALSKFPRFIAV